MNQGFFDRVYEIVVKIPKGKVMTYSQIAKILGNPKNARIVGWALHVNPDNSVIPCHRVVNVKGMVSSGFAFGGSTIQREMLQTEGIIFDNSGKINLEKYGWIINKDI